nr:hypothetical protein [Tanacetum cinerariifolium]
MLNKENYVPWSSRLLRYAKSRPNGKLIYNSIINGPYVRRMIPEPGDTNQEVLVNETFHVQTDDELTEKELKQIEADDQAIQTILLGLPEDIYAAVDSCEAAQEIWLRVQQMMRGSDIGIQEKKEWSQHVTIVHQTKDLHTANYTHLYDFLKYNQKEVDELKAERLGKIQDPLALLANSNNPYAFPAPHQDQPSFNQNYMQQPMPNPKDITYPTTAINMALALMAKAFKLNYSTPTNNNQRISLNPRNRQIAQSGNPNRYNAVQNVRNQVAHNLRVQNIGNQNGLIGVPGNVNMNGNGNLVAARAEGNASWHNGSQIRCYNCMGVAGSESRPPMLNKENYVPWSSRLLRYAKSRPNRKLIHNSILNGPYVKKMIPEPGDANREITVTETFHLQIDDELSDNELKQIEADDQAIQTILLGLPEDSYAAIDSCETAQEIWLQVQQMMKGFDIGI